MRRTIFKILIVVTLLLSFTGLVACSSNGKPKTNNTCRLVLAESEYYTSDELIKEVPRGSDAEFTLKFGNGYTFGSASYAEDKYVVQTSGPDVDGIRTVSLTLNDVKYPTYIDVSVKEVARSYTVSVESAPEFRCENSSVIVSEGEPAEFILWFDGAYTFGGAYSDDDISYRVIGIDGALDENNERRVALTIDGVKTDTTVTVAVAPAGDIILKPVRSAAVIGYALNGGEYIDKEQQGSYYTVNYPLAHHPRPNTSIGTDKIKRSGHTLIGWNTKADGSGVHIGLGSRASVYKNQTLMLYAEWAKHTDPSLFEYTLINTCDLPKLWEEKNDRLKKLAELAAHAEAAQELSAVITDYSGNAQTLVIPSEIDGNPVRAIAPSAVVGNDALKTVILHDNMYCVAENAFSDCGNFSELYLFDSLNYLDGSAFGVPNRIKTMHINAKLSPIYGYEDVYGHNESTQFANKMEMLIGNADEQKTVIFGSCSAWYGIHAQTFGSVTDRLTFNMGVEGDTCSLFQLDIINRYMKADDTLIYICDMGSPFLMLYELSFASLTYQLVEANYDLLAQTDLMRYVNVIPALGEYLISKHISQYQGSYDDYISYISEYGDMEKERVGSHHDGTYRPISAKEILENDAFDKMNDVFSSFADRGIDVYFGFGTISDISVTADFIEETNHLFYGEFERLNIPAKIIAPIDTAILSWEYFYDYAFRLNAMGAQIYTQDFIKNFLLASEETE